MSFRAVAMGCMILAAGCQPAAETESTATDTTEASPADPTATITQLRNDWVAAAERDDAAGVAALYAEDALFLTPENVVEGRAAIEAAFTESFKTASGLTVTERTTENAGDVVYSTGDYTQKVATADGKTADVNGSYLVITRRQADGTWKIVRHVSMVKPAAAM